MNQMKADLAQAQAKVQELTKENEQLKTPRRARQRHLPQEACRSSQEEVSRSANQSGKDAYTKISIGSAIAGIIAIVYTQYSNVSWPYILAAVLGVVSLVSYKRLC